MKYKYNGQVYDVSIKALDSMPVGTIVDYDGTSANVPVGWEAVSDNYFSYKVLWENSSPTSDFASQNIPLNSNDYTYYEIIFKKSKNENLVNNTGKVPKGCGTRLMEASGYGASTLDNTRRDVDYINDTTLGIGNGTWYHQAGSTTSYGTDNNSVIPIQVIGYK